MKRRRRGTTRNGASSRELLGKELRKLQPKLRMIANASSMVNALRAERSSCVAVTKKAPRPSGARITGSTAIPISQQQLKPSEVRGTQRRLSSDVLVNVFIETTDVRDPKFRALGLTGPKHRKGNLIAATVKLSQLRELSGQDTVSHIELGEPLAAPQPTVVDQRASAPDESRWSYGTPAMHRWGKERVLIGIIDVQGFDFSHPDFLVAGRTRFERIWDQAGSGRPSPRKRGTSEFDYGAEFRKKDLDSALLASRKLKVPPYEIERQSEVVVGSHGTHVASIAAGKRGICRDAPIAAVLISLAKGDLDRRQSFYDSTRIAEAIEYLLAVAAEMKLPISINISLGTNGHSHDASSAVSRWVDSALAAPGRCVTVAAGNAGQEIAEYPGDRGFVMGRIHTSGVIPARGLAKDIEWIVVGNGIADVSENELEIWYGAQDRFAVSVLPPGPLREDRWIGPVEPGEYKENVELPERLPDESGGNIVSIYNELYHPANGSNYIAIYLSPFYADSGIVGIPAGPWTIRLHGREVRDGRYHGWIERDDPRPHGRHGDQELWSFPSFFAASSNVDNSSVSSLACGHWVISVANLDEPRKRINITSSQGPTRDNRNKPDVAAPGTGVIAAKGFAGSDDQWIEMTGTSMASPYVAGVAGLMLATNPKLTAAQIIGIMQRTSAPLPGGAYAWVNDAGFGVIDPDACLAEAERVSQRTDLNSSGSSGAGSRRAGARRRK
jgi:subtilisin family serine protease